jgi:uridine kinase
MLGNSRAHVLQDLAARILAIEGARPIRVAIDGRTACGKTTFADELEAAIRGNGRPVIRTSIDGFHRPKAERYARGRYSAEGYYFDARDLSAIRKLLLDPLGPDGDRRYRTSSFDLENDIAINAPAIIASPDVVLIVDGTFLQRPELEGGWDLTIFLRTSERVSEERGIKRDTVLLGGRDVAAQLYAERYLPAFRIYEAAWKPELIADAVVDNNDLERGWVEFRTDGRFARW